VFQFAEVGCEARDLGGEGAALGAHGCGLRGVSGVCGMGDKMERADCVIIGWFLCIEWECQPGACDGAMVKIKIARKGLCRDSESKICPGKTHVHSRLLGYNTARLLAPPYLKQLFSPISCQLKDTLRVTPLYKSLPPYRLLVANRAQISKNDMVLPLDQPLVEEVKRLVKENERLGRENTGLILRNKEEEQRQREFQELKLRRDELLLSVQKRKTYNETLLRTNNILKARSVRMRNHLEVKRMFQPLPTRKWREL
jgi:hypothetical protein